MLQRGFENSAGGGKPAYLMRGSEIRRRPAAERRDDYHRRERRSGAFSRSIQLPYRIESDRIEAHLENGVLRLSLARPEEDKPRRITIRG